MCHPKLFSVPHLATPTKYLRAPLFARLLSQHLVFLWVSSGLSPNCNLNLSSSYLLLVFFSFFLGGGVCLIDIVCPSLHLLSTSTSRLHHLSANHPSPFPSSVSPLPSFSSLPVHSPPSIWAGTSVWSLLSASGTEPLFSAMSANLAVLMFRRWYKL